MSNEHCGNCGVLNSLHPKPPETTFWVCPAEVIRAFIFIMNPYGMRKSNV